MKKITELEEMRRIYDVQGYVVLETGISDIWIMELLAVYLGSVRGIWGKRYEVNFRPDQEVTKNSVAQSATELPPHTDGSFEIDLPPSFILQCIESDLEGYGVSVLIDSWKVIEMLSKQTLQVLLDAPFKFYRAEMGKEVTLSAPIIERDGASYQFRYRNDRKHPLIPTSDESSQALKELVAAINSNQVRNEFQLKPGDILWANNKRMIHGRTELSNKVPRKVRRFWLQSD